MLCRRRSSAKPRTLLRMQGALESTIRGLADQSAHTSASANILAIWEELNQLEQVRTGTYNVARGLLDNAYMLWDMEGTTHEDRRETLESMQTSHKILCGQIVTVARLAQDIKVCDSRYR